MSPFASVLDLHITETAVRARDVTEGMRVRPTTWSDYYVALQVVPSAGGLVLVYWRCDAGDRPPGPFTAFAGDEWVAVAP